MPQLQNWFIGDKKTFDPKTSLLHCGVRDLRRLREPRDAGRVEKQEINAKLFRKLSPDLFHFTWILRRHVMMMDFDDVLVEP